MLFCVRVHAHVQGFGYPIRHFFLQRAAYIVSPSQPTCIDKAPPKALTVTLSAVFLPRIDARGVSGLGVNIIYLPRQRVDPFQFLTAICQRVLQTEKSMGYKVRRESNQDARHSVRLLLVFVVVNLLKSTPVAEQFEYHPSGMQAL